jgi:hypothetical protein
MKLYPNNSSKNKEEVEKKPPVVFYVYFEISEDGNDKYKAQRQNIYIVIDGAYPLIILLECVADYCGI